jgi:hypothetical protein
MPGVRPLVPKIEDRTAMFSFRSTYFDEEESDQWGWNTRFGQTSACATMEPLKWTPTAQGSTFNIPVIEEKNESQVLDLISKIRLTSSILDRKSIAQRLLELLQDVKDEETENPGVSIGSLRSFYSFLQIHSNLKRPIIGLTPVNDIYVSWKAEPGSVFSIHFLSSGVVRFVIIAPDQRAGQQVRLSGLVNIDSLMEKVKPWGVLKWAGREGR